ncbi:MAG: outer membrane beta-barrel protein, partial [Bacteroidota bacterium]
EEVTVVDTVKVLEKVEVIDSPDNTKVTLGENEVLIVEENGDTVRVILGSRGISIVEGEEGTEIKIVEMDEIESPQCQSSSPKEKKKKFKPHFAGLEIGLNNYVTSDFSMSLPSDQRYMDLNTGKSWNWNLNILDYGFGLGTDKVGIATGLGFEFINYNFDGQNSIRKDDVTGNIVEYVPDYAGNITKSKMNITYMTAPLLLEFQIPAGKKRIHISGGVIGGVKLWSNTKMKYTISSEKSKEKAKGDYNLSPLRWGFTARVGYRALNLYANYYMMPLFKEDQGPELYPFSIGLALIPF